jgi:hypothetical protein
MIFTLEALEAKHGDALLLHWGPKDDPMLAVLDGGPAGTYRASVRPRLEQLRDSRAPDDTLRLDFVIVSHIDDDHIHGILDLTKELVAAADDPGEPAFEIVDLWHNSFNDVVGDDEAAGVSVSALTAALGSADLLSIVESLPPFALPLSRDTSVVVASVPQGRRLRDDAARLALNLNNGLKRIEAVTPAIDLGGVEVTFVGPLRAELEALEKEWDEKIKPLVTAGAPASEQLAAIAAFTDDSIANLSSIAFLAKADTKTMLLTGDARGDKVIEGLKEARLLTGGVLHVDILKVPHHGSERNVAKEFFETVTANDYVISADGEHGNPDTPMLEMLADARSGAEFTIHLTNHDGKDGLRERLDTFEAAQQAKGSRFHMVYRGEPGPIRIDLGEPLED